MGMMMDGQGVENGKEMMKIMGGKTKYRRMDKEEEEEEEEERQVSLNNMKKSGRSDCEKYVFLCAIFASLNSILLGYVIKVLKHDRITISSNCENRLLGFCRQDWSVLKPFKDVGVMSGVILFIKADLHISEVQEEVLIGCLSIASLLGSFVGGRTADSIGRKWTIGLAAIVFQTGAAIMAFAPSFPVLMVGRLLAGVGIGFGVVIAPIYIAEISPTITRGSFTSFPEIFINLGILLGYISNYAFSGLSEHISWRIMLGIGILPSVFIGFALFVIPESPRWLVMQKRGEEARSLLLKISENEGEANQRLAEIEEAASGSNQEGKPVWQELLRPSPALRRMMITGFGIQCFQQITGIDATVYYSPTIFQDAGIKSESENLAATIAVGVSKTAFILVAIFLIDRVGRKPLLYVSTIGMTVCLFGLGLALSLLEHELVTPRVGIAFAILAVCSNVAFFSVGIGPVCWVLSSEIFPLRVRAQAGALGAVGNRLSSGLVAMSFLSLTQAISVAGTFFMFSAISAVSVVFVYMCVPETKGKSLEEIEMLYQNGREWQRGEVELDDVEHLVHKEVDTVYT